MKDSFLLYTEQKEIFENLTDEQAGKLIKQIFNYLTTGEEPHLDSLLKIAFIPIRQNIDRNAEKWEDVKKKRSEAGKIGAEIKKQRQANKANDKFAKSNEANQAVNVNDNVNENVNVNANVADVIKAYEENIAPATPMSLELLTDYCKELSPELVIEAIQKANSANKRSGRYIKVF